MKYRDFVVFETNDKGISVNWFLLSPIFVAICAVLWALNPGANDMRFLWAGCFALFLGIFLAFTTWGLFKDYQEEKKQHKSKYAEDSQTEVDTPDPSLAFLIGVLALLCFLLCPASFYWGTHYHIEENEVAYLFEDGEVTSERLEPGFYKKSLMTEVRKQELTEHIIPLKVASKVKDQVIVLYLHIRYSREARFYPALFSKYEHGITDSRIISAVCEHLEPLITEDTPRLVKEDKTSYQNHLYEEVKIDLEQEKKFCVLHELCLGPVEVKSVKPQTL